MSETGPLARGLAGDCMIESAEGPVAMRDTPNKGFAVLTRLPSGQLGFRQLIKVVEKGPVPLVRVVFDSGHAAVVAREHVFYRLGVEPVPAERLRPGDRLCPRLVEHRERVGCEKVARFRAWTYWARPVPGFGDPAARLLVVGLAPAAQGANRTGRMFTGDESGNWLYAALHRAGFASQPVSRERDDGLRLADAFITAVVRCAPPANRPAPPEIAPCRRWLLGELALLPRLRVAVALGKVAHDGFLAAERARGAPLPRPLPRFAHGAEHRLASGPVLLP